MLSPQVLIDVMRALIGDPELPGWIIQNPAVGEGSYLGDGVLTKGALLEVWGPSGWARPRRVFVQRDAAFANVASFVDVVWRRPAVRHFSGHGMDCGLASPARRRASAEEVGVAATLSAMASDSPTLVIEEKGVALLADAGKLMHLFEGFPPDSLVFLAARESVRVGEAVVAAGVGHVIATTSIVDDALTTAFTSYVYNALLSDASDSAAFSAGDAGLCSDRVQQDGRGP